MTPTDTMTDRTDAPQDGRRQRSARSRVRIVEAMFALIRAGDMNPSAAALAEEANVGIRTVFRHFDGAGGSCPPPCPTLGIGTRTVNKAAHAASVSSSPMPKKMA